MSTKEVYIFGAGGHGKVIATILDSQGIRPKGFLDDDPAKTGSKILGIPVLGGIDYLISKIKKKKFGVVLAVGNNERRKRIFDELLKSKITVLSAIHRSSIIHKSVQIGNGTVAMAGVIVNADARIGENVILNTRVSVDHECVIGDHVHLAPGVTFAGRVAVGEGAFVGMGSSVVPGVRIGAWSIIGAGSVVREDVPAGQKVAGVPARIL